MVHRSVCVLYVASLFNAKPIYVTLDRKKGVTILIPTLRGFPVSQLMQCNIHLCNTGKKRAFEYLLLSFLICVDVFVCFSWFPIARSGVRFLQPLARFSEVGGHFHAIGYLDGHSHVARCDASGRGLPALHETTLSDRRGNGSTGWAMRPICTQQAGGAKWLRNVQQELYSTMYTLGVIVVCTKIACMPEGMHVRQQDVHRLHACLK